jgi:amino acid transporter
MFKFTIIIILGIILAISSAIFVTKNFLVDYKGSESGFKNVSNILLIVVALICSLISVWEGFGVREILTKLENTASLSEEMIVMLQKTATEYSTDVTAAIIVGYICFILAYLVFKNIQKEIQREFDKPKRKWDWNKIEKN